jgi:predicted ATPase
MTRRLPVERHAEAYGVPLPWQTHDEMKVARVKAVHDPTVGTAEDPQLLPVTVATALRLKSLAGNVSIDGVAAAVAGRHVLVVLDNCEHLIDAAARMAETL